MNRLIPVVLLVLGLLAFAWFNWSGQVDNAQTSQASAGSDSRDGSTLAGATGSDPTKSTAGSDASDAAGSQFTPAEPGQGATPTPARSGPVPGTGPRHLTPENEQRLENFAESAAAWDPRFKDLYTLAQSEKKDPEWSDDVEQQLQASIRQHGAQLVGIQTRVPHCTQTVCMLVATGGMGTDVANADWQTLMSALMNEPWFALNFSDTSTSVQGDAKGVMYITYFIRKR